MLNLINCKLGEEKKNLLYDICWCNGLLVTIVPEQLKHRFYLKEIELAFPREKLKKKPVLRNRFGKQNWKAMIYYQISLPGNPAQKRSFVENTEILLIYL